MKAVFFDRDNTINLDKGYTHKVEDLILLDTVIPALQLLQNNNFKLFIVSNQSGVGRGRYTEQDMHTFNNALCDLLHRNKIKISGVYCCPHKPDEDCDCRKPKPGLIHQAQKEFPINLSESFVVGDRSSDIELGNNLNMKSILVQTGKTYPCSPDFTANNLLEAAEWIINEL